MGPADLQPRPQAVEVGSGTLGAMEVCAAMVTWRRISSSSSESVAVWPSVPSVASTCVEVPRGCCVLMPTCLWGTLSGNTEDSQGANPRATDLALNLCCGAAVGSSCHLVVGRVRNLEFPSPLCTALELRPWESRPLSVQASPLSLHTSGQGPWLEVGAASVPSPHLAPAVARFWVRD